MGIRAATIWGVLLFSTATHARELEFCSSLLAVAAKSPAHAAFRQFLERPALRRYASRPETQRLREAVAKQRTIEISQPFRFNGSVAEENGVLTVVVYYIGSNRPPETGRLPRWWNLPGWLSWSSQQNNTHRGLGRFDPTFAMAMTGLFRGINDRLVESRTLERIVIDLPSVQNGVAVEMFRAMGFSVYSEGRHFGSMAGHGTTGAGMNLILDLVDRE